MLLRSDLGYLVALHGQDLRQCTPVLFSLHHIASPIDRPSPGRSLSFFCMCFCLAVIRHVSSMSNVTYQASSNSWDQLNRDSYMRFQHESYLRELLWTHSC